LDFNPAVACGIGTPCVDGTPISQRYGDIAGVLNVSYATVSGGVRTQGGVAHWTSGYETLQNVAYANPGLTLEITFELLKPAANTFTLNSAQYAAYLNRQNTTSLSVLSLDGSLLSTTGVVTSPTAGPATFSPAVAALGGLRLRFGPDAFNTGIDKISFDISNTVAAVPEPATWAMLIGGFGLIGGVMRSPRRKPGLAPSAA
jgi:hypothetical protein